LAYYNSVKLAAKMDIPDAEPIYDDLKQSFVKKSLTLNTSWKKILFLIQEVLY